MSEDREFVGWLNPLQFLEVDEPWASHMESKPSVENALSFLCTPGIGSDLESLVSRYREISQEAKRLFAAPAEERILNKMVWPLRHAKASYMVGNYLGTISLCGMVAEMVAILLFEMSKFQINNEDMSDSKQSALFGSSFEKLSQDRRVKVLRAFNIIDDKVASIFEIVRLTRRKYLHLWTQNHDDLATDAVKVYTASIDIVIFTIGQDIKDGKIYLNPALVAYLNKGGDFMKDREED